VYHAALGPELGCLRAEFAVSALSSDTVVPEGKTCALSPSLCSMDYNSCKQSSLCACPPGYEYTAATGDCVLV
jgi:hypothetical protein